MEQLGLTYADVSTSGAGVHANYRGSLPVNVNQEIFSIDGESREANDDLPGPAAASYDVVLAAEFNPRVPAPRRDGA